MRTDPSAISLAIQDAIGQAVLKHIDVEAFAKSVAP